MTIVKEELMNECCPKHLRMGTARMEEIFLELCPAGFGEFPISVVLSCRLTPTGQSCQECWFSSWWSFRVQPCPSSICTELCMLFKIMSNPMHPLSGALPLPYVPARVTRGALVAHRHSFAPPRCKTSQHRRSFVPLSVSLFDDLSDPVFHGVGLADFKSRANAFLLA